MSVNWNEGMVMDILKMSLSASVFILIIVIIRALALHRLPKMTFLLLWVVALCCLLIPFSVPSRFSIYTLGNMAKEHFSTMDTTVTAIAPNNTGTAADTINISLAKTAAANISPFMIVWLIGLSACALFFVVTHLLWRKEYKTALPVDNEFVNAWQQSHPTGRKVKIRQSDRIGAPLTYGIFRPVILLPKYSDWSDETMLQYILTHEYTHIKRFDTLTKFLLAAAVCVHWFNPFVWIMYVLANRDIELSCDEAVVRALGETMKSAYAQTLIGLEEKRSGIIPLVNNFSKNAIEERIISIMRMKKTSILVIVAAVIIVAGATMVFATSAKSNTGYNNTVDSTESPSLTAVAPSSSTAPYPSSTGSEATPPSAKPVTNEALSEYWKMGALNVNGVPYLPLVATAENLGYTVNVTSHNVEDLEYIPGYTNIVEYNYEILKDGKSLGIASLDISGGKVVQSLVDDIFCNTHDQATHTSIVLQKDVVYMPAQFFKEALDIDNRLP